MSLRLCFEIDKELGLITAEGGEKRECYVCVRVGCDEDRVARREYEKLCENARRVLANLNKCDISLIRPITLNKYLDETENTEEEIVLDNINGFKI